MEKQEVIQSFLASDVFKKWHFFKYHFQFYLKGQEHLLAKSITETISETENIIPRAGQDYINKIVSINDKPNHTKHFEQLLQVLAELMIVHKASTYNWSGNAVFAYEPTAGTSEKNPELTISTDALTLGIEVKSPDLVAKHNERATKRQQLPSRSDIIKMVDKADTMLPRDNPVKDFLISADKKFEAFKATNPNFYGVLVIVWDDFIYEPISAISSSQAGMFTDNSFAKDKEGNALHFTNVDCVIITRHLLPIVRGTRGEPLPDLSKHPLDYGRHKEFPFKVIIKNPWSNLEPPAELVDCFQVLKPGPELGAEYLPSDFITWMNN